MRRALLASLTLIVIASMTGCSGSNNSSSSGGGTTTQSNSLLNGQYAFSMSGYDSTGNPMSMAGSFKADGAGHITAGDVDVNDNDVISSSTAVAGTYAFDPNAGPIGKVTLTNSVGSVAHPLILGFAINSTGTFGSISDLSTNNFIVAGTVQLQNSSIFTLASLAAPYIVTVNGRNAAQPTSALGSFILGANGATTADTFDVSVSGVNTAGPVVSAVTFASAGMDANGRGTFTLALNDGGLTAAVTQTFAYYAISSSSTAGRFVAVEIDALGTMLVDGSRQTAIPTTAVTTGATFGMAGFDTTNSAEICTIGQLQIASLTSGSLAFDSNDNGAINTVGALPIQTVAYNPVTGRGTASILSGVTNGLANSLVFYLTASGTGFIMDNTTGTTNRAMAGTLTAQTGVGSFSVGTDLPSNAIVRAKGLAATDAQSFVGEFGLTTTASVYAIVADERFPQSSTITTQADASISPITVGTLSAATGRGTLLAGSETLAFYVVAPNQFVFIDISPSGNPNNGASPLFFATPD